MTKTIWTGTGAAIVTCAVAAFAAQPPSPQTTTSSAEKNDKKVVLVGCLKEAPASSASTMPSPTAGATGTTGTTGAAGAAGTTGDAAAAAPKYILTNATPASAENPAAATTAPPATTTAPPATTTAGAAEGQTYRLIANPTALTPHVGKKLELTGTLETQAAAAPEPAAGADANAPTLRVESGRIVAPSCSQ